MTNEIQRTLADYASNLKAIRENKNLSAEGRRAEVKALYDDTNRTVSKLRHAERAANDARQQQLRMKLFGHGGASYQMPSAAEAVSTRDARDRVAAIRTPQALGELMQAAHEAGDKVLLRAAAGRAFEQSQKPATSAHWGALVDEYVKDNPGESEAMAELADLGRAGDNVLDSLTTGVSVPAELRQAAAVVNSSSSSDLTPGGEHFFR